MRYALDTEFIDTPQGSALISLALVCEDGREVYFEFDHPKEWLTPWLHKNVVPYLDNSIIWPPHEAARAIRELVGDDKPEIWCYFGAYDWYWFCRLFGGMFGLPDHFPMRFRELADLRRPEESGNAHNALDDARGIMAAVKAV